MPPVKTHQEARLSCCAACGRRGAKIKITQHLESLVKQFARVMIALYSHTLQVSVDHAKLICTARKRQNLPKSLIYGKTFIWN